MCAFYAQLTGEAGEAFVTIDFFFCCHFISFLFFIVKVSWKSFLNGFECVLPAMTLIIEMLIKPNKFQWTHQTQKSTRNTICFVSICACVCLLIEQVIVTVQCRIYSNATTLSVSYAAPWLYRKHKQNYMLNNGWRPMNRVRKSRRDSNPSRRISHSTKKRKRLNGGNLISSLSTSAGNDIVIYYRNLPWLWRAAFLIDKNIPFFSFVCYVALHECAVLCALVRAVYNIRSGAVNSSTHSMIFTIWRCEFWWKNVDNGNTAQSELNANASNVIQ